MRNDTGRLEVSRHYAAAHTAHYETKDLREALELYQGILANHPGTPEAAFSQSQMRTIIEEVVPERELFEAHVGMAMAHFGTVRKQARSILATPVTAEAGA